MMFFNSLFVLLLARDAVKDSVDDATIETKWSEFKKANFAHHYRQMVAASKTVSFELRPNDHFTEGKDVFDKMKGLVLSPHFKQQLSLAAPTSPTKTSSTTKPTTLTSTTTKTPSKASSQYAGITGALEVQLFKKKNGAVPITALSLSEQNVIDCTVANYGCKGGWMADAWAQIANEGGIDTTVSYPYTGVTSSCRFNPANVVGTDKGTVYVKSGFESALLDALKSVGPISVAIATNFPSFHRTHVV